MQQYLSTLPLGGDFPLQMAVLAGIIVALALAIYVIYRLLFAHRLRLPGGGRARQPRLGLVDAFSLDGQRQLVLVRRDNIEHLVMIGGPNDVVIESQIIRAIAPAQVQPVREREMAPPAAANPPTASPAPSPVAARLQPRPESTPGMKPLAPAAPAALAAAPKIEPSKVVAPPAPPPRPAFAPPPPPRATNPTIRSAPLPSPIPAGAVAPAPRVPTSQAVPTDLKSPPSENRQSAAQTAPRVTPTPAAPSPAALAPSVQPPAPQPSAAKEPVGASPPPAAQETTQAPPPSEPAPKGDEFEGLDSLEAEMSRLLGRENSR